MKVLESDGSGAVSGQVGKHLKPKVIGVRALLERRKGRVAWQLGLNSLDALEVATPDRDDFAVGVA